MACKIGITTGRANVGGVPLVSFKCKKGRTIPGRIEGLDMVQYYCGCKYG